MKNDGMTNDELPDGWLDLGFEELNSFKSKTIDPSDYPNEVFELYSVPTFPTRKPELLAGRAIGSTKQVVEPGDVLICKINPRINRVWKVKPKTDKRQIASSEWIVMRAKGMNSEFLRTYFCSQAFREILCEDLTGVGGSLTRAQPKRVAKFRVPIAPLAEQKRIADKLEAVLARVDACRARLDRVPDLLKRFRQSVLAAATSGQLTEDWRGENGDKVWNKKKLTEIGELGRGKSKHRPRNDPRLYGGPYPFIQTGDVANSRGRIRTHSQTYSELGLKQSKLWPASTLCITIAANIADTAILDYEACFPDSVVGFVADRSQCHVQFIKWAVDVIKDDLEAFAPATAQKNINLGVLYEIELSIPPLAEQTEIVRRVEALLALADRIEARLTTAQRLVERLTPATLSKAFRGDLVPQDPNDELASQLLERLKRDSSRAAPSRTKVRKAKTTA